MNPKTLEHVKQIDLNYLVFNMVNEERFVAIFKSELYETFFLMNCIATEALSEEHMLIRLQFLVEVLLYYPKNFHSYFKDLLL